MESIKILVTLDKNYLFPLQIMLTSLYYNSFEEKIEVYLMHRDISEMDLELVRKQCELFRFEFFPIQMNGESFQGAPVTKQYPQEMYYRLLAPCLLPNHLDRILYLDPDVLIINPIRPLWEQDFAGNLFCAASHTGKTELVNNINQVRLGTNHKYYNSGVLLMNLKTGREEITPEKIFSYAADHGRELLLPDQDILNALFGNRILEFDDYLWNYDVRNYNTYFLRSGGVSDMDWVMKNTRILHFCGKSKPWQRGYSRRFGVLYKHYIQLTRRSCIQEY